MAPIRITATPQRFASRASAIRGLSGEKQEGQITGIERPIDRIVGEWSRVVTEHVSVGHVSIGAKFAALFVSQLKEQNATAAI